MPCMQEVSQYADMERGLGPAGYTGVFAPRPGGRRKDGCATFYKVGIPGCPRGGVQWGHWCIPVSAGTVFMWCKKPVKAQAFWACM